jgi:hypothetical protein
MQARHTSILSFDVTKVSEMLSNTPKHYFEPKGVECMLHNCGPTK